MSEIYYAMIIFPLIFMVTLSFIFQSSVKAITVEQTKLACPPPINAGRANLTGLQQNSFPPIVNYTIVPDGSNSTDYHVTLFRCTEDFITHEPQVDVEIYTTTKSWFDVGTGTLFYVYSYLSSIGEKLASVGALVYLFVFAPAQVSVLSFFVYINSILIGLIALGVIMVARGN